MPTNRLLTPNEASEGILKAIQDSAKSVADNEDEQRKIEVALFNALSKRLFYDTRA